MGMRFNTNNIPKKPLDEQNDAFMQAANQATDQYLQQNQNDPMAFMDVLQGSILPPQDVQVPFAPPSEEIESIETVPEGNKVEDIGREQSISNFNMNIPKAGNYDRILNELRALRESGDADIKSARETDSDNELVDSLMKGGSKIGDAFANRAGFTNIKNTPLSIKSQFGERAEKDRSRKIEDLMNEYKLLAGKDQADATRAYREAMLRMQQGKEERADQYLNEKQKTEERIARQQQINTARGLLKDDKRYQKLQEQSMAFDGIKNTLNAARSGNQAAVSALGSQLARAMGEVGVLTDTDVVRYLGSTSWGRKLQDWCAKGAKGELSKDTLQDIQSNIGNIEKSLKGTEEKVFKGAKDRLKTAYPAMDDSDIYGILGYNPSTSNLPPVGSIINKNGKRYKVLDEQGNIQEIK